MAELHSVEISKIVLDINGKKIDLSLEEAKELRMILNETFGKDECAPIIIDRPYPYPIYPYRNPLWSPYWQVTCDSTTGTYVLATKSSTNLT